MEFLVRLEFAFPDEETKNAIVAAERDAGNALQEQGVLLRIWRDPGQPANWTLWKAADATEFHTIFSGLPAFPYFRNVRIHPLASHPIDPGHQV
ncbi:muconolactone Delta-isomerase [Sphingobium sp. SA916]|uniref:muconolactone Delta-isomerase n=1 Tax=Sphingobium sp. SA916 TaxID=1851207 RepID=UPI000C9FD234|nr:muconolactone Delta-isomerase family protein [Sphingobium sp. SA916]PNP96735.1 hypothetical protein A8G00_23100 [Sphingobium sp. SA916]